MTMSERIAAAIKSILDEDRRADRERIAELERDLAALRAHSIAVAADLTRQLDEKDARMATWMVAEDDSTVQRLNKQLDELTEKCAALVLENKRLREDDEPERKPLDVAAMNRALDAAGVPPVRQEPTLRIDPDMSDPQPGKLLVVRLDAVDVTDIRCDESDLCIKSQQFVGFLVETPAVKQGAWVVACDNGVDPADYWTGFQWSTDIGRAKKWKWTEQPTWNGDGRVVFMSDLEVEKAPAGKRTPQVGDKVRFNADSNHPGIIGVVSHDLGDGSMLVSQGSSNHRTNFVAMPTDLEVIE